MLNPKIGENRTPFGHGRFSGPVSEDKIEVGLRLPSGGEDLWFVTHGVGVSVSVWHLEIFGRSNGRIGFNLMKVSLKGRSTEGAVFTSTTDDEAHESSLHFKEGEGLKVAVSLTDATGTGTLINEVRRTFPICRYFTSDLGGIGAAHFFADNVSFRGDSPSEHSRQKVLGPLAEMFPTLVKLS